MVEQENTSREPRAGGQTSLAIALVNAGVLTPAADFLQETRALAGFRVAPRQVIAAIDGLRGAGRKTTPVNVAEVVAASQGERSRRQRRHGDRWHLLAALFAANRQPADPGTLRAFIGQARAAAGVPVSDGLLLEISLVLTPRFDKLDPVLVGQVAKRVRKRVDRLDDAGRKQLVLAETNRVRQRQRSLSQPKPYESRPIQRGSDAGKRRWRPGGRRARPITMPRRVDE